MAEVHGRPQCLLEAFCIRELLAPVECDHMHALACFLRFNCDALLIVKLFSACNSVR